MATNHLVIRRVTLANKVATELQRRERLSTDSEAARSVGACLEFFPAQQQITIYQHDCPAMFVG